METGGPGTSASGRSGRGLDFAVWALVIAGMAGVAAAVAWFLSNAAFTLPEITFEDDSVDVEVLIPVAPAAEPSPPDRAPDVDGVTPPRWIRQPAPLYPELALRRGVEAGAVVLRCEAIASGSMGACEVLRESPPGVGFAEAALASTRQARIEPRTVDGVRTDSRITYTIRFLLAPEP